MVNRFLEGSLVVERVEVETEGGGEGILEAKDRAQEIE
jgi:hypothetical protein